jgi:ABC-type glutathione transport system ATPase component
VIKDITMRFTEYWLICFGIIVVAMVMGFPSGIMSIFENATSRGAATGRSAAPREDRPFRKDVMELLRIDGAGKRFGDFVAVSRVSLTLPAGRLTAIIGPNGAGKTTLINLATGAVFPDSGALRFKGEDITRLAIHHRVRKGLSRSFQIMNIFARLSVLQNILVPVLARQRHRHPISRDGAGDGSGG